MGGKKRRVQRAIVFPNMWILLDPYNPTTMWKIGKDRKHVEGKAEEKIGLELSITAFVVGIFFPFVLKGAYQRSIPK